MKSENSFQIQQSHASSEQLLKVKKAFNKLYDTRKLNQFQEKYGNIYWQNALKINRGGFSDVSARGGILNEETIIIPIVNQGEQVVKAYLEASLLDSVLISIKTAGEYDNFQFSTEQMIPELAEKYAVQFMLLNKEVFNDSLFKITDKRLFWGSTTYLDTFYTEKKVFLKAAFNEICVQIWTTVITNQCPYPPNACPNYRTGVLGPCDGCPDCQTSSTSSEFICDGWWQEGGSGGSGDSGGTSGSSSSGSSGGGGSSTTEPCNPGGLLNSFSFPCGILEPPGWEPIDPEDEGFDPQTPCEIAQNAAKKLDTLYINSKADSVLSTIPDLPTEPLEKGFIVFRKVSVNPQNPTDTTFTGYETSQLYTGTDSSISFHYTPPRLAVEASFFHTHPPKGYAAQSALDIYTLIENSVRCSHLVGDFVAASGGSQYGISITDPSLALTFLRTKPQFLNGVNWNETSEIGEAFDKAKKYFEYVYKGNPNQNNLVYEMAMSAVLKQFDTGITLTKKDATGKFKPIIIKTSPDPRKPKRLIYTQEC